MSRPATTPGIPVGPDAKKKPPGPRSLSPFSQPAFHYKRLEGFDSLMTDSTLAMLERWERADQKDTPLDISVEMTRLTLRVAGQALFSLLSNEVDTVGHTFAHILPLINSYTNLPFPPLWVPTPRNRHLLAGLKTLDLVFATPEP